jgi:hypothetical protein
MLNVSKAALLGAVALLPRHVGRAKTRDQFFTYDAMGFDSFGNHLGRKLGGGFRTHDGKTVDSTGAFLIGELERLDQTMHEPLAATFWARDMEVREDVTIADEVSSFTQSSFGSVGGLGDSSITGGKAWVGKNTNEIAQLSLDIAKVPHPLRPWALELKYTVFELESAAKLGRPVDQQKFDALKLKHQMDTDAQVYVGDSITGDKGLLNYDGASAGPVTNVTNVANGGGGSPLWSTKSPDEILADVNELITSAWTQAAYAVMPGKIGIPPVQFGYIATQKVSQAGNQSILKYLLENNIRLTSGQGTLEIVPMKWAVGCGVGGTIGTADGHDRMIAYTQAKDKVRFPMTLLQRTPLQYDSIFHKSTYFGRLGVVEVVYAETVGYRDGL